MLKEPNNPGLKKLPTKVRNKMGFAKKVADSVIFMDEGEIIEQNDPKNFFNNPQNERTKLFLSQILNH